MLKWHKKLLDSIQETFGLSMYAIAWIAFFKGLILGILIYHFIWR